MLHPSGVTGAWCQVEPALTATILIDVTLFPEEHSLFPTPLHDLEYESISAILVPRALQMAIIVTVLAKKLPMIP
jgi:hypothetical protein